MLSLVLALALSVGSAWAQELETAPPVGRPSVATKEQAEGLRSQDPLTYEPQLPADSREVLESILAREEFQRKQMAAGETPLEQLLRWISGLLGRFGMPSGEGFTLVATLLLVLLVILLVYLLTRLIWAHIAARAVLKPGSAAEAEEALTSSGWLKLAREAVQRGDYRAAIRYRFKAVVSRLDLPASAVQTNWQLMRIVAREHPAAAGSFPGLVAIFEDAWYGGLDADSAHYSRADELAGGIERALTPQEPA